MCYNYERLNDKSDSNDQTKNPDEHPLPFGKAPSDTPPINPAEPAVPHSNVQQNIGTPPPRDPGASGETGSRNPLPVRVVNDPLFTRVIEDDELSVFEHRTLRFARWGFLVAIVTLLIAIATGLVFYGQFSEMANQTDLLSRAAKQARIDAKDTGIAAAKQLEISRNQAKAAQDSANAIQRQTEIGARPWLELSEIALTDGMRINAKGEANSMVHIEATNIGKTPAREVAFWAELGERFNEHQEIQRMCTMETGAPQGAGKYGQVLFPTKKLGEKENRVITIKLKPLTLVSRTGQGESIRMDKNGPPSSQEESIYSVPSSVIGCIQYKSFTSNVPYYTGFIYEINMPSKGMEFFGYNIHFDRKTGNAVGIPATIHEENGTVTIPLDWLRLTENQGWGNDIVK